MNSQIIGAALVQYAGIPIMTAADATELIAKQRASAGMLQLAIESVCKLANAIAPVDAYTAIGADKYFTAVKTALELEDMLKAKYNNPK